MKQEGETIHKNIQEWYKIHGRVDLPWRTTSDPYHIYLSEVMLQQTQVTTVLARYYYPFLKKFPTLKLLGESPLDEVLKMWEGLGYYNRAKNLHTTAGLIGELPSEIEALIALPGIGKNTAHAIATFAYKKPVPIMEANVKRILCRLYKLKTPKDKELWEIAYILVDKINPFNYNQAMMDIGATLCTPKNPKCDVCPLLDLCEGKNNPTLYPAKIKKIVPIREQNIILYVYNDTLSLTQRTGNFLHGLWGFGATETPPCASEYIGEVRHAYTHFKLLCKIYMYDELNAEQNHYFTVQEIQRLAISKVDEKIVKLYLDTIQTY